MAIDASMPGPQERSNDDYDRILISDDKAVASLGSENLKLCTVFFDDGHTYNAFPNVASNMAALTPAEPAFEESLEQKTPDEGFWMYYEFDRGSRMYRIALRDNDWLSDDVGPGASMPSERGEISHFEAIQLTDPEVPTSFSGGKVLAVVAFMKDRSKKLFHPDTVKVKASDTTQAEAVQSRVYRLLQTEKTAALLRMQRLSDFKRGFPSYFDGNRDCVHRPSCRVTCNRLY